MNFELDEEHRVLAELAEQVLADDPSWAQIVDAGLISAPLSCGVGGSGLGAVGMVVVAMAAGRHVCAQPIAECLAAGLALGDHRQAARIVDGAIVVAALEPSVIPFGQAAQTLLLVDDHAVRAVDASSVTLTAVSTTDQRPAAALTHRAVTGDAPSGEVVDGVEPTRLRSLAMLANSALLVGVSERALQITAEHLRTRTQFGQPLGAFQATRQRAADAYITIEAMRTTLLAAAWRFDHDPAEANEDVLIAAWWASHGGQQVTVAAQHLHGGIGADTDYPVHRSFLWATQLAHALGAPSSHLAELGALIAKGATA